MSEDWLEGGDAGGKGEVVTKSALSTITGLSLNTVDRAIAEGAPVIARGNRKIAWRINSADFCKWYVGKKTGEVLAADDSGLAEAQRDSMAALAKIKTIQADAIQADTVTRESVVDLVAQQRAAIRKHLAGIPAAVAQAIADATDASVVESILDETINAAFEAIVAEASVAEASSDGDD